jgi:hypothetical protein
MPLHFHHSFFGAGDSDIAFQLSSGHPGGSDLDFSTGKLAVSGTSTFQGGVLGGDNATLLVPGTISPVP